MLLSPRLGTKLHTSQQYEDSFPSKVGVTLKYIPTSFLERIHACSGMPTPVQY